LEKTPAPKDGTQEQKSKLLADFQTWEKEYAEWLKTSGKLYGEA
jgi:hypothetical protein